VLELGADVALDYTKHDVMHQLQQLHRYIHVLIITLLLELLLGKYMLHMYKPSPVKLLPVTTVVVIVCGVTA